ncbi:cytidylyltransferase domain-containing protein [Magnetospirillum sp. UT-4]|uniref:cytidylyltransferase domain-containing protein n=1 Tax=Magnetospirillum sp. UT-4 TaxID=2681467 RepID=UPI001380E81E|nr:glycosyltransferase family protein [Magnetospirillum sp. UT-4]CAA7618668.1 Spore coat polysaccharide biosynthesis protein F [Magnetospirillum sp. UT-4]
MTTALVVQARMGSSRLPGKVLMDLAGRSFLWHCLARCAATPGIDVVVCATTDSPADDAVAEEAARCGAQVFRGSETDVLARYQGAAAMVGAKTVMRVTSDCPFTDPELNGRVLAALAGADYACNNMPPGWPHGLDCEAFPFALLQRAAAEADQPFQREHVTPWIRTNETLKRVNVPGPGGAAAAHRWTLDHPEDRDYFRAVLAHLPPPPALPGTEAILAVLAAHPELSAINAARADHGRLAQSP